MGLLLYFALAAPLLYFLLPWLRDPYDQRKLPGPRLAAFTNFWLGLQARKGKRFLAVHKVHQQYGTIARISPNHVSIADPEAIPVVYGHGTGTLKSDFYDAFVSIHRGLFNTRDRSDHTRKRKIVSYVFSAKAVGEFEPYIRDTVSRLLKKWDRLCQQAKDQGQEYAVFDCLPWLNFTAFDSIGDLAFGAPFGMIDKEADVALVEQEDGKVEGLPAVQILNERGEFSATQGVLHPYLRPYTKYIDPWFRKGQTSVNNLAGIARQRVNARLESGAGDRKDLLSMLQNAKDQDGNPMPKTELTAEALTQTIAGSDTTSNSSCAIIFWIAKHPRVQKKLVEELDSYFAHRDIDGVIEFEDGKRLPYLQACIDEALRLHSTSAMGLPRILQEPIEFKGQYYPAGSILSVPTYTIHRLESVWGDPLNYRPERWLEKRAELEKSLNVFSYGPRSCVGRNVANMQLVIWIATFFYRYDFRLEHPEAEDLETSEGFLRKPLGCDIGLRRRVHS